MAANIFDLSKALLVVVHTRAVQSGAHVDRLICIFGP